VQFLGAAAVQARNPIVAALEEAGPGSVIRLQAGDYPAFGIGFDKPQHWNARTRGGSAQKPILVQAQGPVRILPAGHGGDTLSINQAVPNGHITFEGITFVPSGRAGIFFFKLDGGKSHTGYRFLDCHIEGGWDHATDSGQSSKWGVWGHSLKDFEFSGVGTRARIRNLRYEHAFYLQNCRGNVTIENVDCSRVGRTFIQVTARQGDGAPGTGTIILRNNRVEDVAISKDDNHKGGSAFTFAGRHRGLILVEKNTYRAGFDPKLRHLTRGDAPYGTGAVAAWDGGEPQRNGTLVLKSNVFEMAPGCGDRALVALGGCDEVRLIGDNRFVCEENDALAFDPLHWDGKGRLLSKPNTRVYMGEETVVEGKTTVRGRPITDEQREEYAKKPEPKRRRPVK